MELQQKTGKVWNTPARVNHILSKYGLLDEKSRLDAAAVVDLKSVFVDVEYIGTIGFGTPPQYFEMNLDTGSADIWLPTEPCPSCLDRKLFQPNDSSTFEPVGTSWALRYGDGSQVIGTTAKDTVRVGDATQTNQTIGLAYYESSDFVSDKFMDGIFGLAFPSLSYTGQTTTIVESLYEQGQIDEPVVGIYLGRVRDAGGKGEAYFGGVNPNHYTGDITYIPVTQKKYWQVAFGGIEIDGQTIQSMDNTQAIIDTGTTLTVLPPALARAFHQAIPGAQYSQRYGWRVPCDAAAHTTITFKLGGQDFPVPIVDMIRERSFPDDPSLCFSGVAETYSDLVIMGDTFLRNYYSVYDYRGNARIGLAPSKA
ncbi:aspartic peptidase domain-containing protein [Chlamydoabsidia padenii]|nr:aspartic peptidase domain-containing protein [Chlamydoabsidia padenii]